MVEVPNPRHPFGAKGVGEVPIVPPLAAVANAVRARDRGADVRPAALAAEDPRGDGRQGGLTASGAMPHVIAMGGDVAAFTGGAAEFDVAAGTVRTMLARARSRATRVSATTSGRRMAIAIDGEILPGRRWRDAAGRRQRGVPDPEDRRRVAQRSAPAARFHRAHNHLNIVQI